MAQSVEIIAYSNRTEAFSVGLLNADGSAASLNADDSIRVKIGRGWGTTPVLDLVSGETTGNGSGITITSRSSPAAVTLNLAQADLLAITPGAYEIEVALVDSGSASPADAIKRYQGGVIHIVGTLGGNVSLS